MSAPDLKVVTIHESNYRDPVATLRLIADGIEKGEYGDVASIALVMLADKLNVMGMGPESDAGQITLILQAGMMFMARPYERHGREND